MRTVGCLVTGRCYNGVDCAKRRATLDCILYLLPAEEDSVSCSFLLKLLRTACLLESGESHRSNLIKRTGTQLNGASVSDLLIPATSGENSVYNIDWVMEIVEEFMLLNIDSGKAKFQEDEEIVAVENLTSVSSRSKLAVAKLIDAYLAEMVSSSPRPTLDGLYRAIDMFLKEHPSLSKSEKKKLCGLMDCKLLSQDASMHAVQNERLPLRVVVQVLFEQNRASVASAGGDPSAELTLAVPSHFFLERMAPPLAAPDQLLQR